LWARKYNRASGHNGSLKGRESSGESAPTGGQVNDKYYYEAQGAQSIRLSPEWTFVKTHDGNLFAEYRGDDLPEALDPGNDARNNIIVSTR
jgi:hypothetical protein